MAFLPQILIFLLSSRHVYAEYGICENTVCATADACAQECAAYAWGYNMVRFGCNSDYIASCVCDSDGGHSSTMDQDISMCPTLSTCGGTKDATVGMAIFSAYCKMNLNSAATVAATTTQANTDPATNTVAGLTPNTVLATSTQTEASSPSSSTSSSSGTNSLSISDKIAIGCAIGGALVTIAVAVPTWRHKRNKRNQAPDEAEPLHGPPQVLHPMYPYPAQQPFIPQPQPMPNYAFRPAQWGWQGYK